MAFLETKRHLTRPNILRNVINWDECEPGDAGDLKIIIAFGTNHSENSKRLCGNCKPKIFQYLGVSKVLQTTCTHSSLLVRKFTV